jgi:hypothetical protein
MSLTPANIRTCECGLRCKGGGWASHRKVCPLLTGKIPEPVKEAQKRWAAKSRDKKRKEKHGPDAVKKPYTKWPDGRRVLPAGYVIIRVPVGHPHAYDTRSRGSTTYAYEHIVVAMQTLGRPLRDGEVVHHINGRRDDNRPENLRVLTASEHMRLHHKQRMEARC